MIRQEWRSENGRDPGAEIGQCAAESASCDGFVLIAGKLVFYPLTVQLPIAQIAAASHYAMTVSSQLYILNCDKYRVYSSPGGLML